MGEMNRIPARATATGVETPFGPLPPAGLAPGPAVLCLRPEAIGTGDGALRIGPATVRDAAFFGTHCRVHLVPQTTPDLTLIAHLPPGHLPVAGDILTLAADTATASVFAAEG
jgi:spermidine/putrescine transport system ATP-binding protein